MLSLTLIKRFTDPRTILEKEIEGIISAKGLIERLIFFNLNFILDSTIGTSEGLKQKKHWLSGTCLNFQILDTIISEAWYKSPEQPFVFFLMIKTEMERALAF